MSIVPKTKEDNFVETKEGKLILDSFSFYFLIKPFILFLIFLENRQYYYIPSYPLYLLTHFLISENN